MSSDEPMSGGSGEHGDDESAAMVGRFGTTLRRAAVWEEPPDDLGDRIIARVGALRAGDGHVGDITPSGLPAPDVSEAGRRRGVSWVWPGLAVAAAALVAFAAGALLTGDDDAGRTREPVADVVLMATDLSPGARAEGDVADAGAGFSINIDVSGLPPAPIGEYYEGWLHDAQTDDWVSVGTFHMRDGDGRVVLWSGVPLDRYNELVVTSEVEGSTGGHGDILLEGQFQPR
jgi:Anti-sigma-K factor rskA